MAQHHMEGLAVAEFYIRRCEEEFHALALIPRRKRTAKQHAQQAIKQAAPLLRKRGKL